MPLEIHQRQRAAKPAFAKQRAVLRDRRHQVERALMLVGFRVEIPQCQTHAIEPRRRFQRLLEKPARGGWRFGHEPLHVQLEHLGRGREPIVGQRRRRGRVANLLCQASEHVEQIGERSRGHHFRKQATAVEPHDARAHRELVAIHQHRAAHHRRRRQRLADPDGGRAAERGVCRQLQAIEGLQPFLALDHRRTRRGENVGEKNGCTLAHPGEPGFLCGVVERNDDDGTVGRLRLRGRRDKAKGNRQKAKTPGLPFCLLPSACCLSHVMSHRRLREAASRGL